MGKHKCKLCPRKFADGRALGGHMKSHLTPSNPSRHHQQPVEPELTESASSFSGSFLSSSEDDRELGEHNDKSSSVVYGLRENPKRSFKLQDPEFSSSLDRESETDESKSRNPTGKRSKRTGKEYSNTKAVATESEQLSSVSDTSTEEDLAMCLMLLSRDANWVKSGKDTCKEKEEEKKKRVVARKARGGKFRCEKCTKRYRSSQALSAHKRICALDVNELSNVNYSEERIFECPYCFKLFGSGQALGGHKRSHLINAAANNNNNSSSRQVRNLEVEVKEEEKVKEKINSCLLDLNLPASREDEDFSVVLEA